MGNVFRLRPNHYEVLGLERTASAEEVAQAFARELRLFRPRAFGGLAEVSVAYETLRDPSKRQAYDALLGFKPAGPAHPRPEERERAPVMHLMERLSAAPSPPAPSGPPAPPEPAAEPSIALITARLRETASRKAGDASPAPTPEADQLHPPHDHPKARIELLIDGDDEPRRKARAIGWDRTALAVGALFAGAVLVGAWTGLEAGYDVDTAQRDRAVTLALPPAKPLPPASIAPTDPARNAADVHPERSTRVAVAARRIERPPAPQPSFLPEEQAHATGPEPIATDPAVAQAPAAAAAASRLPLPSPVIARTLARIGFACGQVASVTPAEASGVFTVACTSGHSYRAAPVHGRYRFRRLG